MADDETPEQSSSQQDLKRALFKSPNNAPDDPNDKVFKNAFGKLMMENEMGINAHYNLKILQKDDHEQRLKDLKTKLKDISEDNWRYEPVEKLIGISDEK